MNEILKQRNRKMMADLRVTYVTCMILKNKDSSSYESTRELERMRRISQIFDLKKVETICRAAERTWLQKMEKYINEDTYRKTIVSEKGKEYFLTRKL